ncbi:MAG: hypothetical protein IIZ28_04865 [Erysipelotrichaceae bacterium]|nr:hypothetical protein [Erysipelotrichaceae bacterium]
MKKILIRFFILLVTFTCFSYAIYFEKDEEEHIFHVHVHEVYAIAPGDVMGTCPTEGCGGTLVIVEAIQPENCTTPGFYYVQCNNYCGYMTEGEIPAPGHSYVSSTISEATCTREGTIRHTCSVCGANYDSSTSALGHDYRETVVSAATCTSSGLLSYECSRCGDSYTRETAALGHDYRSKVTKEATCTEDGVRTYTCSRCNDRYTRKIEALGHDIEYEEKEATCTEAGYKKGVCKRCKEEIKEVYPALGHDVKEYKRVKEPTCTEDGRLEGVCERCGETQSSVLPKLGHKYPEEWTVEKEPTYFADGLEYKLCSACGDRIEQIIPHKDPTPIIVGGGGAAVAAAAGIFLYMKKFSKLARKGEKMPKEKIEQEFEDKSVLYCGSDESLLKTLKSKKFLEVTTCEKEELEETAAETEADLLIVDVHDDESFDALIRLKDETLPKQTIGIVAGEEYYKENKAKLDSFKEDKTILDYVKFDASAYEILVKLVLPVLKPDLKSDEALTNIGAVADALGIPGISTLIDVYVNGRDIKATVEEGELSVSSTATVIADIASILGLDTVASVAGLVDDVDSIKAAADKEAGANERKYGVEGAKDIVDVVSDIINKDE